MERAGFSFGAIAALQPCINTLRTGGEWAHSRGFGQRVLLLRCMPRIAELSRVFRAHVD